MIVKWLIFKNADEFKYLTLFKPYEVLGEYSSKYDDRYYEIEDDDEDIITVCKKDSIYDYVDLDKKPISVNGYATSDLKPSPENVTNPYHYTNGNIETIDYLKDTLSKEQYEGFCRGNVLKYLSRYPHKNGVEDLNKAKTYLEWLIESVKE